MIDQDIKIRAVTCAECGKEFFTDTPIEVMLDEYVAYMGAFPPLDCKTICDSCFKASFGFKG